MKFQLVCFADMTPVDGMAPVPNTDEGRRCGRGAARCGVNRYSRLLREELTPAERRLYSKRLGILKLAVTVFEQPQRADLAGLLAWHMADIAQRAYFSERGLPPARRGETETLWKLAERLFAALCSAEWVTAYQRLVLKSSARRGAARKAG